MGENKQGLFKYTYPICHWPLQNGNLVKSETRVFSISWSIFFSVSFSYNRKISCSVKQKNDETETNMLMISQSRHSDSA